MLDQKAVVFCVVSFEFADRIIGNMDAAVLNPGYDRHIETA